MKHLLITTIAAALLVGCSESQQTDPAPETKAVAPIPETKSANPGANKRLLDAVAQGDIKVVKELLTNGANVGAKNAGGETVLNLAVFCGHKKIVELLIENGANVNERYHSGETPLHLAAHLEHKGIVELLIKNGADVNAKSSPNPFAETPLDKAGVANETVDLLRRHGAKSALQLRTEQK